MAEMKSRAMLRAIGLRELDPGDLGDRVPFVGRLERPGQQRSSLDRLRRRASDRCSSSRGRAASRRSPRVRGLDDVRLDHQVVVEEVGADRCRWRGCRRPWPRRGRSRRAGCRRSSAPSPPAGVRSTLARSTVRISQSSRCEPAHQRRADHAAMAGDPDTLAGQAEGQPHSAFRRCSLATVSRSSRTISAQSSIEIGLVRPAELAARLGRIADAAGRPRSGGNSAGRLSTSTRSRRRHRRLFSLSAFALATRSSMPTSANARSTN